VIRSNDLPSERERILMRLVGNSYLLCWPALLAERTGIPIGATRSTLKRLEQRGLVSSEKGQLRMYSLSKRGQSLIEAIDLAEAIWAGEE
jgi:DNA-binding MarR family transcriptional regulator